MFKKLLGTSLCVVLLVLSGFLFTYFNLKCNAVYYAEHTPHKPGRDPVLTEVVDNLFWINTPDLPGIEYDFDGGDTVYTTTQDHSETTSWFANCTDGYMFKIHNISYLFDENFRLDFVRDKETKVEIQTISESAVKQTIYQQLKPVIDAQSRPLINLQWLYDQVNHDKFN